MELTLNVSKKVVKIKDYITKGDSDWSQEPMFEAMEYDQLKGEMQIGKNVNPIEVDTRTITIWIAEINEVTERDKILEEIKNLPLADWEQLVGFINEEKKSTQEEKKDGEK